nr:MAG TPA: hypothetical protein [Caudoviricetes sp.]
MISLYLKVKMAAKIKILHFIIIKKRDSTIYFVNYTNLQQIGLLNLDNIIKLYLKISQDAKNYHNLQSSY